MFVSDIFALTGRDEGFLSQTMRGIVAFEMPTARLEAKAKLSQNKTPEDRESVVVGLKSQAGPALGALAAAMAKR